MNTSYDVRIYKVRERASKSNPFQVRWKVAGEDFTRPFRTQGLANGFHRKLATAADNGEPFDVELGLPLSLARKERAKLAKADAVTWLAFAMEYADHKWPRLSANGRRSVAEVLRDITLFLLPNDAVRRFGEREVIRTLTHWAFNPGARKVRQGATESPTVSAAPSVPDESAEAMAMIERVSPPASDLADLEVVRQLLDAFTWTRQDKRASATYFARRRQVLHNVMVFGVTRKRFDRVALRDPDLNWERPSELRTDHTIDPRSVGSPTAVRRMLTAVSYVGAKQGPRFVALFATMYYGMLRPEEAAMLTKPQCHLPPSGWGRLTISDAAPAAGKLWTDSGEAHDLRGLKHRPRNSVRIVGIPPEGVRILRDHIDTFGVAPDGRLFRSTVRDGYLHPSTLHRVWATARTYGLSPEDQATPLLQRPYSLRGSGVSMRRTAGMPAKDVAAEAGHSVEVLERMYSAILTGFEDRWQKQIDSVLDESPGDDLWPQDGHSEPPEAA